MSNFLIEKYKNIETYTPGEQPRDRQYIKLNTNESPFPPSPYAVRLARLAAADLQLYSDPECTDLKEAACEQFGIEKDQIIFTNGSDEALSFAFAAFCDNNRGAVFPDVTYGFYRVFADFYGVPFSEIPLKDDFSIDPDDYTGCGKTIFIANPNAPTGKALSPEQIESIIKSNGENVVVIDEAYVDFGAQTVIPLTDKYDNLLVVRTFSKSRSLAGGRLGFAVGNRELIKDLMKIKYSTNPYNVNRMSMAAGLGALCDTEYFNYCLNKIKENRTYTEDRLKEMGFELTDSSANFVFAKSASASGKDIYLKLKENGVLVRHFDLPKIKDYIRITIGSREEMDALFNVLEGIL